MEVASPIPFGAVVAGNKRSLSCSPNHMDSAGCEMDVSDETLRSAKRRRFHCDPSVESLSERFSSHSPFFTGSLNPNKAIFSNSNGQTLKRLRAGSTSPVQNELKRIVDEQAVMIESLKEEKTNLEESVTTLRFDNDKTHKENQLLRKAVQIQQERQKQAEGHIKAAEEYRVEAEDKIRKLEQVILSLRYHLQAQQLRPANDFMGPRPPDVF